MRFFGILLLVLLIGPFTCVSMAPPPPSYREVLKVSPVPLPRAAVARAQLGPFRLERIWHLTSSHIGFGGYSALAQLPDGRLLAVSDRGYWLNFAAPGSGGAAPRFGQALPDHPGPKVSKDAESVAVDPASGTLWVGWEGRNAISRHPSDWSKAAWARPAEMRKWSANGGPEVMARLRDGRFLVVQEGTTKGRHAALLFPGDPVAGGKPMQASFEGPEGFSPTDAAQLPDGRILFLMRRLVWPMPYRFVGRIALADPSGLRAGGVLRAKEVARLGSLMPVDNFEGLAIVPRDDGIVTVWIISDDNSALSQRTLLWQMALDPAALR